MQHAISSAITAAAPTLNASAATPPMLFGDEVRALRASLHMTQAEFCKVYDIPIKNLQNWEQPSRSTRPDSAARLLISIIKADPAKVAELVEIGRASQPAPLSAQAS